MFELLKRIRNALAYSLAGVVILLAVLVGLFRLLLPQLTEYQEDIKDWATAAIGLDVEFTGMNARWRLSGPELNFYDAELSLPDSGDPLIEAAEVTIGVGFLRLLVDRTLVVDRVIVQDSELTLEQRDDGSIVVQGLSPDELTDLIPTSGDAGDVVFEGRDLAVRIVKSDSPRSFDFLFDSIEAVRRDDALTVEASVDLDDGFGSGLELSVERVTFEGSDTPVWKLRAEGRSLSLPRWSLLAPDDLARVAGGSGDVTVWLVIDSRGLASATANLAIADFRIEDADNGGVVDIDGRVEFSRIEHGFLVAADQLSLGTPFGRWPDARLQLQVVEDGLGEADELRLDASYVALHDAGYFTPWLPAEVRDVVQRYAPAGELRDFRLVMSSSSDGSRQFEAAADASAMGIDAVGRWPGIRGFSGSIRADSTGGRVELRSTGLRLALPDYVPETVILDDALGTVIWRKSGDQLTVLTDRLRLRSTDFDSRTSLQVTVPGDGGSPVVDLDSRWNVSDVGSAKRLLPESIMHPALHRWFQRALVSGSLVDGSTRLVGPLQRFPFDEGDGRFEVTARFEEGVLDYARGWPAAEISTMQVSLVGMRLSTERNVATTVGNRTVDANVSIDDLRRPVLRIDALATGTLESIRQFALRSPIEGVFGGRLDDVRLDGDASFELDLTYPIQDRQNYSFETRLMPENATFAFDGLPAPVTGLGGSVMISRDAIRSEGLNGNFLGDAVDIELASAGEDRPAYSVILNANGRVSAEGLVEGLGAPVAGLVAGATSYAATLRFPKPGVDDAAAIQLEVQSDLTGMALELPAPLAKPADASVPLSLSIAFPASAGAVSTGRLGDDLRWSTEFMRSDLGWDFDRGMLILGGGAPDTPDSRGLHVRGRVDEIRLSDWLGIARDRQAGGPQFIDRIRSIDLGIGHLRLFGQHLRDHRVAVDRSGAEWFVSVSGEQVEGTVTIPYDLTGPRAISLDMQRLILPGDDDETADSGLGDVDPRSLPAVSISAREFAIGERHVGALRATFVNTGYGLHSENFTATDETFEIEGSAGWFIDPAPGERPETMVAATLTSRNVQRTLERLGYPPAIDSDGMEITADVSWPGGPGGDFLDYISGQVSVRFTEGQLNEVEPGAGRIFGLMSIVELPRRLSLDFRDVFDKGFGFDEITGTFRLEDGNAYTCDLSLKGPAADIGIVGRVDLGGSSYEQTALVSANVGNTLPVVGAVVAGPQVAAALLIFSQIFKKPLQEMGQVYYAIEGALDDPEVEVADARRFASTSEVANCLSAVAN